MNTFKLILQYNGFDYIGWQVQPNGKTIQGELIKTLEKITKSKNVKVLGSGRTDSGVHALGQVVKIEIELEIPSEALFKALNSNLPDKIRVAECEKCDADFHPIFHAQKKEYIYAFTLNRQKSPFINELIARFPYDQFDEVLIEKACKVFEGEHDFCNYFCTGTPVSTTVRTIYKCSLVKQSELGFFSNFSQEIYLLKFEGSGFLKQMVRLLVGALWNVAAGKISLQDIENSLNQQLEKKLAPVAPPQGLYLYNVTYK